MGYFPFSFFFLPRVLITVLLYEIDRLYPGHRWTIIANDIRNDFHHQLLAGNIGSRHQYRFSDGSDGTRTRRAIQLEDDF